MTDFAGDWISIFGAALLSAIFAVGVIVGFVLRALTGLSQYRITVLTGALPVLLTVALLYLSSFGHGALGLDDYQNLRSGIELIMFFLVSFLGAKIGVRAFRFLADFRRLSRSKETE